jgi:hypothetical protein
MLVFGGVDFADWRNDVHALGLVGSPTWTALNPTGAFPYPRVYHNAVYDALRDRMVIFAGVYGPYRFNDVYALEFDQPTAIQVSLVSAEAMDGMVRVEWLTTGDGGAITLDRSVDGGGWSERGPVVPDGTGRVTIEDGEITSGHRYGYRLGLSEAGVTSFVGEVYVDVPLSAALSLRSPYPNPTTGPVWAAFTLPSSGGAMLSLVDVTGRRLSGREVGALGAGSHLLRLDEGLRLGPGLYWIVLEHGQERLTARVAVTR